MKSFNSVKASRDDYVQVDLVLELHPCNGLDSSIQILVTYSVSLRLPTVLSLVKPRKRWLRSDMTENC